MPGACFCSRLVPLYEHMNIPNSEARFVAINYITCTNEYSARFEELFASRARAIDTMPGFISMKVLRATAPGEPYLVVSEWTDEASFEAWVGSPEFVSGHTRGFEDLRAAKARGEAPPMTSRLITYAVISE